MKRLNITRKQFVESKFLQRKYGKLNLVNESGKLFKTNKDNVLMFKEDHAKGEHLYSIVIKDLEGWEASFQVNAMNEEDAEEQARSHMKDGEKILNIYDMGEYKAFDADEYAGFNEKTTFNNEQSKKLIQLVIEYGKACEGMGIATADDDIKEKTYWKHQADDAFYEIKELASQMDYTAYNGKEEFDESGSETGGWFDDRGELVKPLPGECIKDCSGSGRVDDEVAYWVNALKFDLGLPRERAINFLSEYGAWELDELDGMDDFNLAEKVLWIFCGNIKEEAYQQSGDETSLVYDWGDVSDWDDEDWQKFQEEYSYCSLNS